MFPRISLLFIINYPYHFDITLRYLLLSTGRELVNKIFSKITIHWYLPAKYVRTFKVIRRNIGKKKLINPSPKKKIKKF